MIYFFIGTTAELIKLFPIIHELEKRGVDFKIITSGQTTIDFDEVSAWIKRIKPDIALPGKANESSVFLFFIWAVRSFFFAPILLFKEFNGTKKFDSWFIVHGDTISSLIGAVISKIFRLRLVHIESGLRSFNFLEPFPEEISRYFVSRMADVHFCPNEWSMKNLTKIQGEKINTSQNTLIESCWFSLGEKRSYLAKRNYLGDKYFVLISHRQEHVVFGKNENKSMIDFVLRNFDNQLKCLFVTHATTADFLKSVNFNFSLWERRRVKFLPRLNYIDFMELLNKAAFIVTDGGSNQEESYYLGLPCLLLRKRTERIEGLGENVVLAGKSKQLIKSFLEDPEKFRRTKVYPKKRPSKIIVDYLLSH